MSTYAHLWISFTGKLKNNQCENSKLNENEKKTEQDKIQMYSLFLVMKNSNINKWKKIEEKDNAHLRSLAPIY